jgi:hypothetical protein
MWTPDPGSLFRRHGELLRMWLQVARMSRKRTKENRRTANDRLIPRVQFSI